MQNHDQENRPEQIEPSNVPTNEPQESLVDIYRQPLRARIGDVVSAMGEDVRPHNEEGERKTNVKAITFGAAALVTQALDRLRFAVLIVPHIATEVLENTQSPTQGAIAGAAAFAGYSFLIGESLNHSLDQLPRAKQAAREKFPVAIDIFRNSLPGVNSHLEGKNTEKAKNKTDVESVDATKMDVSDRDETLNAKSDSRIRRMGSFATNHLRRGLTSVGIGSTAFVATASIDGASTRETSKLNARVIADGSFVVGAIVATVGQAIFELPKHGHGELAENIYNWASDMKTWYALAAISMGAEFFDNRSKKNKKLHEAENQNLELHDVEESEVKKPTSLFSRQHSIQTEM